MIAISAMHANRSRIGDGSRRDREMEQARRDALTPEERDAEDESKRVTEEKRKSEKKRKEDIIITRTKAEYSEEAYKHFKNQWSGLSREKAIKWFNKKYSGKYLIESHKFYRIKKGTNYFMNTRGHVRVPKINALVDFPGLNEAFTKAQKERTERKGPVTSFKKKMFGSNESINNNTSNNTSNNNTSNNKTSNNLTGGKKVRKHRGIIQTGGKVGKLRKGYRYSGKKLKSGLPQIVKARSKKN